jgi:hypothetical protein
MRGALMDPTTVLVKAIVICPLLLIVWVRRRNGIVG